MGRDHGPRRLIRHHYTHHHTPSQRTSSPTQPAPSCTPYLRRWRVEATTGGRSARVQVSSGYTERAALTKAPDPPPRSTVWATPLVDEYAKTDHPSSLIFNTHKHTHTHTQQSKQRSSVPDGLERHLLATRLAVYPFWDLSRAQQCHLLSVVAVAVVHSKQRKFCHINS